MAGVLKANYYYGRLKRTDLKYRLKRRTKEVSKVIRKSFGLASKLRCLDMGTADGLMLSKLNTIFNFKEAIGIDLSKELISKNKDPKIKLELSDVEKTRFKSNYFDIIVSAAVIEHLDNPEKFLSECYRLLKKGGLLIITTPNPFFDKIASTIGYEKGDEHTITFKLKTLKAFLKKHNFKIIHSKHFMFFPFFNLPLENQIESLLHLFSLGKLMTNQLVVGKKK